MQSNIQHPKSKITLRKPYSAIVILLVAGAFISVFPTFWMFYTSFWPADKLGSAQPILISKGLTLSNYAQLFTTAPVLRWTLNSFIICLVITLGQLLFDSMAGYALARKEFPGRRALFWLIIGTMMVPAQILVVPLYIMMVRLHLVDTLWAAILPGLAGPFGIFFMRQYMLTIPTALEEAARMDGCNEMQIFIRVIVPVCAPALGVLAIFLFISNWNSFLWPLLVLNSAETYRRNPMRRLRLQKLQNRKFPSPRRYRRRRRPAGSRNLQRRRRRRAFP
ncbi:MAG: carbohydrate ABC transporter permease [Candidatus Lindowbacteria bacterium]|nr:carbohydrate ABC transporter permease [Candidatus Lindowbacteria bacterium]